MEKRVAAPNWVAAGKRAGWPLSPSQPKNGFEGFASFVTNPAPGRKNLKSLNLKSLNLKS